MVGKLGRSWGVWGRCWGFWIDWVCLAGSGAGGYVGCAGGQLWVGSALVVKWYEGWMVVRRLCCCL
jgi:hypothetical protein